MVESLWIKRKKEKNKKMREKEKLLVTSNFSFSLNVFSIVFMVRTSIRCSSYKKIKVPYTANLRSFTVSIVTGDHSFMYDFIPILIQYLTTAFARILF